MIKVSVYYPNDSGATFDWGYYMNNHTPLLQERLGCRTEVAKGISDTDPNAAPMYIAVTDLYFDTVAEVHEGFKAHGREILGDIANYTKIKPKFIISETMLPSVGNRAVSSSGSD